MKKIRIPAIVAIYFLTGITLNAQTLYDANRLMESNLNGTARFVGMGGAMGALGGDISTIGTNPAGIGIYRSNEAMFSFGFVNTGSLSTFNNATTDTDNLHNSFDNIGFVLSNKIGNLTPLKYVNFGFNYRKLKSFNKNTVIHGLTAVSQTQQFASMVNSNSEYLSPDELMSVDAFQLDNIPWLGAMAYEANLITLDGDQYLPYLLEDNTVFSEYSSEERGGVDSYDINMSFNLYNRLYLGATLGAYGVDYTRHSFYSETFYRDSQNDGNYTLHNDYFLEGSGIDFKLGFIVRPIESSSLRIGAAIHTPTWYQLKENHFARLNYKSYINDDEYVTGETYPQTENGNEMEGETEYRITTPWKYNVSLGYTIGRNIAIGVEYEYSDHSTGTLRYDDNGIKMDEETNAIKKGLKEVHTIRAGAECKLTPEFSFRLGYNHITASTYTDTFKSLPVNAIRTDTEFFNGKATNNYTFGFGYRGESLYVDMAYLYNSYKEDFYAFDHPNLPPTEITTDNHKIMFTLGVRF
ncbi:hypothetical protein EZS27_015468 [termite gut metagenome]|uniref:Hemin receptor n=1 Tax=termite gut metagenome TaxID=433724 RepID=A0A5J4RRL1_9ZZZZ